MRDLALGSFILVLVVYGFKHPWIGVLAWTWVSTMNLQAYTWRLSQMPIAAAIAISILAGVLVTKDRKNWYVTRETAMLMAFMGWMCLTFPFSFYVSDSWPMLNRVMKIDLMVLVATVVLYSKRHINWLAWILAISIGFYGIKGGLFTLATGGSFRVWGPTGTYIEGNNEVALALVMIIPILRYLQLTSESKWIRRAMLASMVLCAIAALGSQSRGALLALGAMGVVMWWRSDKKIGVAMLLFPAALGLLSFMPDTWWDRMETIRTYQDDGSAMGRINAWWMAFNLAKDNLMGGGFMVYTPEIFGRYAPNPLDIHAAHSIYFMVLGEHGFVGLFLFLLLWFFVWSSAGYLRVQGRKLPETQWLVHLGGMCQVSIAGYAVGGAFLSLSYYDLPYNILVLVVLGRRWLDGKEWVTEAADKARSEAELLAKQVKAGRR
jgi:putative inorganic carbon (hco3(-)) transporter